MSGAQFMLTVWRRVFTPFQVAQLTVQTYPHSADILAMIKCARSSSAQACYCGIQAIAPTLCCLVLDNGLVQSQSRMQLRLYCYDTPVLLLQCTG